MKIVETPRIMQAVGLACVPLPDLPAGEGPVARKPVAAAVITLQTRDDGHREIVAARVSDARDMEFPLPWLIDQALVMGAPTLISPADRVALGMEATARRFWSEPKLARLCAGGNAIDPASLFGTAITDEVSLCRRLQIPFPQVQDREVERVWSRHAPAPAIDVALGIAIARLMLWAHIAAFANGEPDAFFDTLLPLRDWMLLEEQDWPSLHRAGRSRPVSRASSFASTYRAYKAEREAGDTEARFTSFEDGLFHT